MPMIENMVFRCGFICYASEENPVGDNTWRMIKEQWSRVTIGYFTLWTHPESRLQITSFDHHHLVLIGEVYSTCQESVESLLSKITPQNGVLDGLQNLDHLSGRFAVLIITDAACYAFHDAFGSRSLFYRSTGAFAVGSHAQLLAHAFGIKRRMDIGFLLRSETYLGRSVRYLPGDATIYNQVYALVPNNYVDSRTTKMCRYWPRTELNVTTMGDFLRECDAYSDALVGFLSRRGQQSIFGITGGIDSRAALSALSGKGIKFRGVTWLGAYLKPEERETVDDIVEQLGIDHMFLTPGDHKLTEVGKFASRNSGNFRGPSRLTQGMYELFGSNQQLIFVRGYGGEIIRGFYNLHAGRMKDLSPPEMARLYGTGSRSDGMISEYGRTVLNCFIEYSERAGHKSVEGLGYDPSDIFYWEHRMGMWGSAMLNEMDPAVYSMVGLNSRTLFCAAFGLPESDRFTKKLLWRMVERNDPILAQLPYF
jgi:hypothetical protein